MTADQITQIDNPEESWEKCLNDIKNMTNWIEQFEACNTIRRICRHHSNLLTSSSVKLHGLVLDLLKITDSLRTSLAKNGLLAFRDMFMSAKMCLDNDLEIILQVLVRKGTETSAFLSIPAKEALVAICEQCSECRVVTALLNLMCGHHKTSPQVKIRIIICIELLLKRIGNKLTTIKEGEKLLLMLATCLSEGALEVRNAAKAALFTASREVLSSIDFDRLLQRALHDHLYTKVKEILTKNASENTINETLLIMNTNTKKSIQQQSPSQQSTINLTKYL